VGELLLSSTVLASFLGGVVALLAPCCVSVMLPAYFASTFHRRSRIVAMTLVFAAGVGTVILPIALGASALSRLVSGQHALVFTIGGAAMIIGGLAMLAGWKFSLPMLPVAARGGRGVWSVYSLGVFSGAASSCCAPVIAGVAALSGAASSFPTALAVGVAYVFGMVSPLAALALVWDRRDWGAGLLSSRSITVHAGRLRRRVPLGSALSGGLLIAMGVLTLVIAARGPAMGSGWQLRFTAWLDHAGRTILNVLSWLPGAAGTAVVFTALAALVWFAVRQRRHQAPASTGATGASEATEAARGPSDDPGGQPDDCCPPPLLEQIDTRNQEPTR
jgi:cytochrome c-type biogenesis protein